jgi:hypothetical protein
MNRLICVSLCLSLLGNAGLSLAQERPATAAPVVAQPAPAVPATAAPAAPPPAPVNAQAAAPPAPANCRHILRLILAERG